MGKLEPASWYDSYYQEHRDPEGMTVIHDVVAKAIADDPPMSILDLGCGPGWFERRLRLAGYVGDYYGIDFSPTAVRHARLGCPLDAPSVFRVGDIHTAEDRPEGAMVVALEVLEHIEDDAKAIKRFAVPGRRVFISVPTYDCDSHVRYFHKDDDLGKRYGIVGRQWEQDRQIYLMGRFK